MDSTNPPQEYQVHPVWWNEQYNSAWDRVKEALRRDWEQTKADLSMSTGRDLHQGIGDTVRQAVGQEPLPLPHQPTPPWHHVEHAVRYGYGAGAHYDYVSWAHAEGHLSGEWAGMKGGAWERIKHAVQHGWEAARRKL